MNVRVSPSELRGMVTPPASKSVFQRVCAAALLTPGTTRICNTGTSKDDRAALGVAVQLGLKIISQSDACLLVSGPEKISPAGGLLQCGESGLCTRLFTPIAALSEVPLAITGVGSLLRRPMTSLTEALQAAGVAVSGGPTLPLRIQGPLRFQDIVLEGGDSSQTATGLLFAMAASGVRPLILRLRNPVSVPYLQLTVGVLRDFGWPVESDDSGFFSFTAHREVADFPLGYTVEADWSSAAVLIIAGTLAGNITLKGLKQWSLQADRILLDVLELAGGSFSWEDRVLRVTPATLRAFQFDATHAPDLVPVLAVAAAVAAGTTQIKGMHRLAQKESNRAETTSYLLRGFGVKHYFNGDSLFVEGSSGLRGGGTFNAHGDHRIAMAAAIGGLIANAPVTITGAEAVSKSYPQFFKDLQKLGATIL